MSYGPPPSDSDEDDYDGMSFGYEFEKKKLPKKSFVPKLSPEELMHRELIDLVSYGSADELKDYYRKNCDILELNKPLLNHGWTPLMLACQKERAEIVECLICDFNVNVNKAVDLWTPLLLACAIKNEKSDSTCDENVFKIVKLLIDRKAIVNVRNRMGETPLIFAAMNGHKSVVDLLLSKNAFIECCDNDRSTPLYYALQNGHAEVAKILIDGGANVDAQNCYGDTPKLIAESIGSKEIDKLFPQEELLETVPATQKSYNCYKDLIPTVYAELESQAYAPDMYAMLAGMRLANVEYQFYSSKINLMNFLSITDERLQDIGVEFPYQRKRLLYKLMTFHEAKNSRDSWSYAKQRKCIFENVFDMISANLKQLIILNLTKDFLQRSDLFGDKIVSSNYFEKFEVLLDEIQREAKKLHKIIEKIDGDTEKIIPLHIDQQRIKRLGEIVPVKKILIKKVMKFSAGSFCFGVMLIIAFKILH